jgi:hypothetical protein
MVQKINSDMQLFYWFLYARQLANNFIGIFVNNDAPEDDWILTHPFIKNKKCVIYRLQPLKGM